MLEYLKLEIGSHMQSDITVEVKNIKNKVYYSASKIYSLGAVEDKAYVGNSEVWMAKLDELHIDKWKTNYQQEGIAILGGSQWSLEYKVSGKVNQYITGDNRYPTNWDAFIKVMDELAPEARLIESNLIKRISLSYHNNMEFKQKHIISDPNKAVIWDYAEKLSIDRASEKLIYKKIIGTGCIITHEYYVQDGIEDLLENCEEYLFHLEGYDNLINNKGNPVIEISIDFHSGDTKTFKRSYNRHGIPTDWENFVKLIRDFIAFYGLFGEIFDARIFKHGVKVGEYIYCSVEFEDSYKSYYYRTEDDTLQIGDTVIVPVGGDNRENIATITNIEYFTLDHVPFPMNRTKLIIKKYDEEDLSE